MRITSLTFAGTIEKGQIAPRAYATASRKIDGEFLDVTIATPSGDFNHIVEADCEEDVWSMAEILQRHLDGCKGTNSMIHELFRELQRLAD